MKKIFILVIGFLILIPSVDASVNSASSYILLDMDTNRVLKGKNIHDKRLIASITNIMTT